MRAKLNKLGLNQKQADDLRVFTCLPPRIDDALRKVETVRSSCCVGLRVRAKASFCVLAISLCVSTTSLCVCVCLCVLDCLWCKNLFYVFLKPSLRACVCCVCWVVPVCVVPVCARPLCGRGRGVRVFTRRMHACVGMPRLNRK